MDLDVESVFRQRLRDPRRRQQSVQESAPAAEFPLARQVRNRAPLEAHDVQPLADVAEIYQALVLGTRDYVRKNGFQKVVLGLSGGIDSALTACVAVDALGSENVVGVLMPSEFSSRGSVDDAEQLGKNLGIELLTIPIAEVFDAYKRSLQAGIQRNRAQRCRRKSAGAGSWQLPDGAFQQVRLAGPQHRQQERDQHGLLHALRRYGGRLRDSEGCHEDDRLQARRLLQQSGPERIPRSTIEKPPSAELRPDQLDTDSLPPYEVLDPILKAYVEEDRSLSDMVEMGFDPKLVQRIVRLVDVNEYKRRQAAPGVKITPRAFGRDRRMPITNKFK